MNRKGIRRTSTLGYHVERARFVRGAGPDQSPDALPPMVAPATVLHVDLALVSIQMINVYGIARQKLRATCE